MAWVPWELSPYRLWIYSQDPDLAPAAGSRVAYAKTGERDSANTVTYSVRSLNDPFPGKQLKFRVTVESYAAADSAGKEGQSYAPARFIVLGESDFTDDAARFLLVNQADPYPEVAMPSDDAVAEFSPAQVEIDTPAGYFVYRAGLVGGTTSEFAADTEFLHLIEVWLDADAALYDPARAWPFAVGGDVSERWEWSTNGLRPPTGMEQTIKLRRAPQVFPQFDGLESGRARRLLETMLSVGAAGAWHVPLPVDSVVLNAPVAMGAMRLSVPTQGLRFAPGRGAMIVDRDQPWLYQVLDLSAVDDDGIDLATELAAAWPVGSCIMPTRNGFMPSPPVLERFTGDAVAYSVEMQICGPVDVTADFGVATYRNLPVLEIQADWSDAPTQAHARSLEQVDYGMAPPVLYDAAGVPLPRLTVPVTVFSRAALAALEALLYAMAGRWKPLWVSTLAHDVRMLALTSSTKVDVEAMDYPAVPQVNRRDVRIEMRDGSVLYRRITAVAGVNANTQRLTMDVALPGDFAVSNVMRASFMALCRQDSDVNVLRLWSAGVVSTQLGFEACAHEF